MWSRKGTVAFAALIFGMLVVVPGLRADDSDTGPAGRTRAARLSSIDGQVQVSQDGQMLTDHAVANTPLFEGSQVMTGEDGRAEVQYDDGSIARLSPEGSFMLKVLRGQSSSGEAEIVLNGGLGYFEMQGDGQGGGLRVRFGDTVVTASGFTVIRVSLDKLPGEVAVFSGNAHLESANTVALDIHGGQSVALNGADPNQYNLRESIEPDSWDAWNSDRDQALTTAAAGRTDATRGFADSNNPAWSDLDANGSWYDVPNQGRIWSPYDASNPGWDPYGSGYWMYTPRYGYMWVSGYSWGYMPFQCGSWSYFNSFGWGWAPGGCNPWWGGGGLGFGYGGGDGWVANIGYAPPRYRLPNRPNPRNPRHMGDVRAVGPQPVISVNRRVDLGNTMLPVRDKTHPVIISGGVAQPLKPAPNRPHYDHVPVLSGSRPIGGMPAAGIVNNRQGDDRQGNDRPGMNRPGTDRPGYIRPSPSPGGNVHGWPGGGDNGRDSRENGVQAPRQVVVPPPPSPPGGGYSRPSPPPAPAPSPRTASPSMPSSRPSGGGGGGAAMGGGGAPRSGGGGPPAGGGGGGHPSGGGSPGPHK